MSSSRGVSDPDGAGCLLRLGVILVYSRDARLLSAALSEENSINALLMT